jgi:hypothetical protein
MSDLNNGIPNSSKTLDDVDVIDYIIVLWKYKWFILLFTILPVLVATAYFKFLPRHVAINYTYMGSLNEGKFEILRTSFYNSENIKKIVERLKAGNLEYYAEEISGVTLENGLDKYISFKFQNSNVPRDDNSLLYMTIGCDSNENIKQIALIYRENFEKVIPLYFEKERLTKNILNIRNKIAGIKDVIFLTDLQLERKKTSLDDLRKIANADSNKLNGNFVMQFNSLDSKVSLPAFYQVQSTETQIVNLNEEIRANKEMLDYYCKILKINQSLFDHVSSKLAAYYTIEEYYSFLKSLAKEYKEPESIYYIESSERKIENVMTENVPLIENPVVYIEGKGTVKKAGLVFLIAFAFSILAAFLAEGLKNHKLKNL